ncbi:NfeD family protein [Haloferula rosea]|uniref:NfeD family protein n=1 Tax=Haloferula rosea TaxID=490093 RepID=A0A934VH49_9BACT|nr:NfeD family protein [Haloferula rosea]MBK1828275.1 NfeD family protein [Haloferula rosea]
MLDPAILWFVAGIILILLEFGAPGVVLCFFGAGAIVTSITTGLGLTDTIASQSLVFTLSSVGLLIGLRRWVKSWFVGDSNSASDDVEDEFTGREARAMSDFAKGAGLVELKGARWNARSEADIKSGDTVIVNRREDLTLYVEPRS